MPRIEYLLVMAYLNGRKEGIESAIRAITASETARPRECACPAELRAKCPAGRRKPQ